MDTLKKYKKLIAIILIMLSMVFIYSFKTTKAVSRNNGEINGIYTYDTYGGYQGTTWSNALGAGKVNISVYFFNRNNFTFCLQQQNDINMTGRSAAYSQIKGPITIDGTKSDVLNGLAYILNQNGRNNQPDNNNYGNILNSDPVQLALWDYLVEHSETIKTTLGNFSFNRKQTTHNTIYTNAENIAKGNSNGVYYKAVVYTLYNGNDQSLMIVDTVEKEEISPKITLSMQKVDKTSNQGLAGAEIRIETIDNVKDIDGLNTKTEYTNR